MRIKLNLISKCRVLCNCLYMLLLISYQTSYENKAIKTNLDKNYKFIKFYRLCDKCAFCVKVICFDKLINRYNYNDSNFPKVEEG